MTTELSAAIRQHIDTTAPPLTLDEINASYRGIPAADMSDRHDRSPRGRLGLAAAAALIALGSVALYATATRPEKGDEASIETSSSDPGWYLAVAPALPDGFQSVAVTSSNEWFVSFESFDVTDGRSLQFTVTRAAMEPDGGGAITLDEALAMPPGQPLEELDISLPDGRQIGVACVVNLDACPTGGGASIAPEELRDFGIHLATAVSPDDLPPPTGTLDHVAVADIRSLAGGIIELAEAAQLEAPHYAMSFVQYAPEPLTENDLNQTLVVRTLTGLYPKPQASEAIQRTDTQAGTTQWIVTPAGVLWSVTDTTRGDPAPGQRLLTAARATTP
jgi:hypothetical protein